METTNNRIIVKIKNKFLSKKLNLITGKYRIFKSNKMHNSWIFNNKREAETELYCLSDRMLKKLINDYKEFEFKNISIILK